MISCSTSSNNCLLSNFDNKHDEMQLFIKLKKKNYVDRVQVKSAYEPSGASGPSLSWFLFSMKQLGVFLLPLGGVLVHGTHLYTWVGCESKPKNTTQCEQSGLGTWMGNLEMSTIRPPCLPWKGFRATLHF